MISHFVTSEEETMRRNEFIDDGVTPQPGSADLMDGWTVVISKQYGVFVRLCMINVSFRILKGVLAISLCKAQTPNTCSISDVTFRRWDCQSLGLLSKCGPGICMPQVGWRCCGVEVVV